MCLRGICGQGERSPQPLESIDRRSEILQRCLQGRWPLPSSPAYMETKEQKRNAAVRTANNGFFIKYSFKCLIVFLECKVRIS